MAVHFLVLLGSSPVPSAYEVGHLWYLCRAGARSFFLLACKRPVPCFLVQLRCFWSASF